ncbi:fibrocystin-like [Notechis scutatus]|uniref:Fibrocystin-like n=1 Tax=Notechis scutatus TaxID=8663 RepID=A0A6J1VEJ4_9SAUR|nr:fibrocystin-like [Notechis scutatus]
MVLQNLLLFIYLFISCSGGLPVKGPEGTDQLWMSMNEIGINLTVQRMQSASPPLGGTFQIHLPRKVIPGIPVSISANQLHSVLQNCSDNFTAQYINASDFFVSKISHNSYQSIWTLSWTSMIGDLPNFIRVSDENLTGFNPAIISYVVFDGGVFIDPIFGDMLATPNNFTQVVVTVNDIPANCSGSCTFQYLTEMTPLVSNIDYSTGGQLLVIGISPFSNYTPFDVKVKIGDAAVQIQTLTDRGISGTLLTISGIGFSNSPALVSVLINFQSCTITSLTEDKILCRTPPPTQSSNTILKNLLADIEVYIGNRSSVDPCQTKIFKNYTFLYSMSLTPNIINIETELLNNSLHLGVEGVNVTNSVAILEHVECPLEVQKINHSITWSQCSLPVSALEPGHYMMRILQKQMGFANVPAEMQHFTIYPQIKTIFPSRGSVCGGQLLTISGHSLKSWTNSAWVNLTGNLSCDVQSSSEHSIICALFSSDPLLDDQQFPDVHQALYVTVNVNGMYSRCLGDCLFHLFANKTVVIDAVTVKFAGILISLLIRIQKLVWPVDEILIEVDGHLPCNITSLNKTSIECQTHSLDAKEHSISVLSRRWGSACLRQKDSNIFRITPQVLHLYPQNFSINGGGLLTLEGAALQGRSSTSVLIGNQKCLLTKVTYWALQCLVPSGQGTVIVVLNIDNMSYSAGEISYSEEFTPVFLSLLPSTGQLLTIIISKVRQMEDIYVFIGGSSCTNVTSKGTSLQCVLPQLPTGEYNVTGGIVQRGWASSSLVFTSVLTVITVKNSHD